MSYTRNVIVKVTAKDQPTCDQLHEAVSQWVAEMLETCDYQSEVDDDDADVHVEDQ